MTGKDRESQNKRIAEIELKLRLAKLNYSLLGMKERTDLFDDMGFLLECLKSFRREPDRALTIKLISINCYLASIIPFLKNYVSGDKSIEESQKTEYMDSILEIEQLVFAPACYDLLCKNCKHEWTEVYPKGVTTLNVKCPGCGCVTSFNLK